MRPPLPLFGRSLVAPGAFTSGAFVARVRAPGSRPAVDGSSEALLVVDEHPPIPGFRGYLALDGWSGEETPELFRVPPAMGYLADGDIVRVDPARATLAVLYRRAATAHSFLLTERCDNFCTMCSQPPRDRDDAHLVRELIDHVVPLLPADVREVCLSGGEPTLSGDSFFELLRALRDQVPSAAIHVLSNGRRFANRAFAERLGAVAHPDLMVGVPVYGEVAADHDFVVQRRGAFDETVRGIIELRRAGVAVEVRVVVTAQTAPRLVPLARFLMRNLRFVSHVAWMGLEQVGFGRTNVDSLWIDPIDYADDLAHAVRIVASAGVRVSVYGHQLCVLPTDIHPVARRAISDWKNVYAGECESCARRSSCGGFFASSVERRSRGIRPFSEPGAAGAGA